MEKPRGEGNTFEITVKGDRMWVKLNGEEVIADAQLPGLAAEGPVVLQHHGGWNAKTNQWSGPPQPGRESITTTCSPTGSPGSSINQGGDGWQLQASSRTTSPRGWITRMTPPFPTRSMRPTGRLWEFWGPP